MTMISVNSELKLDSSFSFFLSFFGIIQSKKKCLTEIHTPSLVLGTGGGRSQ